MHIHWQQQWISIPYKGQTIFLSGIDSDLPVGTILQLTAVQPEPVTAALPDLPPALTQLLQEFEYLFQPPTELPLSRGCDHSIPLIEGASPVFIRPYRYAPLLKTEIENTGTGNVGPWYYLEEHKPLFFSCYFGHEER